MMAILDGRDKHSHSWKNKSSEGCCKILIIGDINHIFVSFSEMEIFNFSMRQNTYFALKRWQKIKVYCTEWVYVSYLLIRVTCRETSVVLLAEVSWAISIWDLAFPVQILVYNKTSFLLSLNWVQVGGP